MSKSNFLIFLDNNQKFLEAMRDYFDFPKTTKYFFVSSQEALKAINTIIKKEKQPNVILVIDYDMPEINGFAFLQKLSGKKIIKILYSNIVSAAKVRVSIATKEIDYFVKKDDVYSVDKLEVIISKHL